MQSRNTVSNTAYKLLIPLVLTLAAQPALAKMYKWVDSQGNVHYTDTLPPNAAETGSAELSKSGGVVKKTESAEERRKRLEAEAEAAERKRVADEQTRKDRALLATYTTEKEIDLARDRALEQRSLIAKSAHAQLKLLEPSAKELEEKVKAASKNGKPAPEHLRRQLEAKRAEVAEVQNTIKTNDEAMAAVRQRYEAEKQRFHELTTKR